MKLHKVTLRKELIVQFKDEALMSSSVKYSFINEMGSDADGVSRDVYAAVWTEFLDCAAEGADVRVPSLSTKWQEEDIDQGTEGPWVFSILPGTGLYSSCHIS